MAMAMAMTISRMKVGAAWLLVLVFIGWGIADAKAESIAQPRQVFIQNKLGSAVWIKLQLEGKKLWVKWVKPGAEVSFRPRDYDFTKTIVYHCLVWTPASKRWCRFVAYNSETLFPDCLGYGCRYLLKDDGTYFGALQDYARKYTGGPYRRVYKWC